MKKITTLLTTTMLLAATSHVSAEECKNELYMGSYQEDAGRNPEDPMPGALRLLVPTEEEEFSGALHFTYIGCQSKNIGSVTGEKKIAPEGTLLEGSWAGNVDNTSQQGSFEGRLNDKGFYEGSYTVAGGKQKIEIEDCIEYYIAPKGDWFLFPVNVSMGEEFMSVDKKSVKWDAQPRAEIAQCQLIDLGSGDCGEDAAVIWQDVTVSHIEKLRFKNVSFSDGHRYAAACSQFDGDLELVKFSKLVFDYPSMKKVEE